MKHYEAAKVAVQSTSLELFEVSFCSLCTSSLNLLQRELYSSLACAYLRQQNCAQATCL